MKRRFLLGALSASSLTGCLRMAATESETATQSESPTETEPGGGPTSTSSEDSGLFATEAEALEYAGGFADGEGVVVEQTADRTPKLIEHGGGSGSSGGSAEDDGMYSSQDIHFTTIPDDGVEFGGGMGRTLHVRNVTLEKSATFTPSADAEQYRVANWSIDAESEGVPPSQIELTPVNTGEDVMVAGSWEGDTDLFRTQAFGEYVIELFEGDTRIGTTNGAVYGIHYLWGAEQTEQALYVTRQPSANESWNAALYVGETRFDPTAIGEAIQQVEENVFKVDLTELELDSGRYSWELLVGEGMQLERNYFITLRPITGELLIP